MSPLDPVPFTLASTPLDAWRCELFGMGESIVIRLPEGAQPCAFWRLMQRLAFGNKWARI